MIDKYLDAVESALLILLFLGVYVMPHEMPYIQPAIPILIWLAFIVNAIDMSIGNDRFLDVILFLLLIPLVVSLYMPISYSLTVLVLDIVVSIIDMGVSSLEDFIEVRL